MILQSGVRFVFHSREILFSRSKFVVSWQAHEMKKCSNLVFFSFLFCCRNVAWPRQLNEWSASPIESHLLCVGCKWPARWAQSRFLEAHKLESHQRNTKEHYHGIGCWMKLEVDAEAWRRCMDMLCLQLSPYFCGSSLKAVKSIQSIMCPLLFIAFGSQNTFPQGWPCLLEYGCWVWKCWCREQWDWWGLANENVT